MNKKIKECYDTEFILGYMCTMDTIHYLQPYILGKMNMEDLFLERGFFYEINEIPNFVSNDENSDLFKSEENDFEYRFPMQKRKYFNEEPSETFIHRIRNKNDKNKYNYDHFTIIFHYSQFLKQFKYYHNFRQGPLSYECIESAVHLFICNLLKVKVLWDDDTFDEDEFRNTVRNKFGNNQTALLEYYSDIDSEINHMGEQEADNFIESHKDYISSTIDKILKKRIEYYLFSTNEIDENLWYPRDLDSLDK